MVLKNLTCITYEEEEKPPDDRSLNFSQKKKSPQPIEGCGDFS
jgi:hypothetical protein